MNQKSAILILSSAAALALAGCDRVGVGVGASTSEAQSQSQGQEVTQSRALGDRQERAQSVALPFAALAVPALLGPDAVAARGLGAVIIRSPDRVGEDDLPGAYPPSPPPGFSPQAVQEAAKASGWPLAQGFEAMAAGRWAEGVELVTRGKLLALLEAASQPGAGWPVRVKGPNTPIGAAEPSAYRHAENVSVAACWASKALLRVHEALPKGHVLRSAEEVRERVREAYLGLPLQDLKGDLATCRQELLGARITLNLSGVQGQQWAIGPLYVTRDARGTTFTKNGVPWYGDGLIESRRLELAATQAITSEMVMAAGSTRSTESRSGEETSGSVGVGK